MLDRFRMLQKLLLGCMVALVWTSQVNAWQRLGANGEVLDARQQRELDNWPYRFDLFQMLFEQNELKPVQSMDYLMADPKASVAVVIGELPVRRHTELLNFLAKGGNVLFASDVGFYLPRYFHIRRGPLVTRKQSQSYAGYEDCLRITDLNQEHPLCDGVAEIIVNQSGWIENLWRNNSGDVVARAGEMWGVRGVERPAILAMRQSPVTDARLIVCADQSIFSNGMMWHGDNARLAVNVCEQLCEGDKKQLLFLVNGQAQPSYLLGPIATQLPLPDQTPELGPEQMLAVANAVLNDVEDQDLFNAALTDRPRGLSQPLYIRAILFAILAGLGFLMLRQFFMPTVKQAGPLVPPRTNLRIRTKNPPPSSEIQFRTPESRQIAAKLLSQEFCEEVTSSSDPDVWERELTGQPTASKLVSISMSKKLNLFLRRIVQLATERSQEAITSEGLIALRGDLAELRRTITASERREAAEH